MSLIAIINGPNLNTLGSREPEVYGLTTLEDLRSELEQEALELGVEINFFQSNHEGAIIDYLQGVSQRFQGLIINPGGLTHYGDSLRDALASLQMPIVEVHISNIFAREEWRANSVISDIVTGTISGLGTMAYKLGLRALVELFERQP